MIFKTIYLNNGNYLIINKKGIYTYNNNPFLLINSYNLENELLDIEIESISYFEIIKYYSIFILIKNKLFIFNNEGEFKYICNISEISETNYSMTLYKYSEFSECFYFIEYRDLSNNFFINLYRYDFSSNKNIILSSKELNITYDNIFECQTMINSNKENYLTCFFIGKNNKDLLVYNFNIGDDNNLYHMIEKKYSNNNIIKMIKSETSIDKTKSLICFINDINNINCILYDLNTKIFIEFINPINDYIFISNSSFYAFNIEKNFDSNNFYLYYFFSSKEFS